MRDSSKGNSPYRIAWFAPRFRREGVFSQSQYLTELLYPKLTDTENSESTFQFTFFAEHPNDLSDGKFHHYLTAFRQHQIEPFDLFLYHFDDTSETRFVEIHSGLIPGAIWFHSFLRRSEPSPALHVSPWRETVVNTLRSLGLENIGVRPLGLSFKEQAERDLASPYALRLAGISLAQIFSLPQGHSEFLRVRNEIPALSAAYGSKSWYLPVPVVRPPEPLSATIPIEKGAIPSTAGKGKKTYQIIFCGSPYLEHRSHRILAALDQLLFQGYQIKLNWLIAEDEIALAHERAASYPWLAVNFKFPRTPDLWQKLTADASVALHPFFSVFGSVEPYLGISLMAGLPTVVSPFGSGDYLPDNLVWKVPPDNFESSTLVEVIKSIFDSGGCGKNTHDGSGRQRDLVVALAEEIYSLDTVTAELKVIIRDLIHQIAGFYPAWRRVQQHARVGTLINLADLYPKQKGVGRRPGVSVFCDPFRLWVQPGLKALGLGRESKEDSVPLNLGNS